MKKVLSCTEPSPIISHSNSVYSGSKASWQIKDEECGFHHGFIDCTIRMVSHQQHESGGLAAKKLSSIKILLQHHISLAVAFYF